MESLTKVADIVLTRHISKCKECELTQYKSGDNWKPCEFHRGFVAGIIALLNQIHTELESVGFNG
jgi:hypothetical protein